MDKHIFSPADLTDKTESPDCEARKSGRLAGQCNQPLPGPWTHLGLLTGIVSQFSALGYSEHVAVEGTELRAQACAKGLEGIISKLASAPYVMGRQKSWLKAKCALRQEFIIVGYSAPKSGDRALGALRSACPIYLRFVCNCLCSAMARRFSPAKA
jgi:hypothetical protein